MNRRVAELLDEQVRQLLGRVDALEVTKRHQDIRPVNGRGIVLERVARFAQHTNEAHRLEMSLSRGVLWKPQVG